LPLGSEEQPAQNYLDFYRGFLIGLDSVRMAGHSVNLSLHNTKHDYNRVTEILSSGALDKADLVVGPIYEDELIPVAAALQSKGTPIVSPLANLTQSVGNHLFQMSPAPKFKLEKVRGMFDGSKRVVIISTDKVDREFDAEVRSMLRDTSYVVEHKYVYEHPSVIEAREKEREKARAAGLEVDETPSPSDMSPLLRGNTPTVIVITADNEVEVDRILAAIASANIALTARSQRVVPFVVFGNNRWNRYRNIDRAILFTNNVTMLSTYHARRSEPKIKAFDKRFVEEFNSLPSLYAYRGYDAAVVFVKALYGAMADGMIGQYTRPLLTPYTFEQDAAMGVRVNTQWIKVNYNSNFTITTE
jgi:ABC-type branched-subunit amino acid transport system substrate-binding protein